MGITSEDGRYEWVTPSEVAKREGITTSMVYVRMKEGHYETHEFVRGRMKGYLIKTPVKQ